MAVTLYHKYRACFSSVPFTIPTPFDAGNNPTNNQHFVNFYYNQSAGFTLVPGTFIRLYDNFYPATYTCYEYLGTSTTPETFYIEYLGGNSLQNSGYYVEPYGDCSTCEIDPSVFAYHHSWRYCDASIAFNPVPVVPMLGSCFLPRTVTNVQAFQDQLIAALGPITIGDVVQLSDGTCMYYEGVQARPTSYDIDVSNNPASGDWHAGYPGGACGNTFGTPPTRGLLGSVPGNDCQLCPVIVMPTTTTTTGIQPITTTTTRPPTTTSTTTIMPITTTTTTCHNCCSTTTTTIGVTCPTCGIESCCVGAGPPVQYNATGNLLTFLNAIQCNTVFGLDYAFQIPTLLVGGNVIQNECWKPLCNPNPGLPFANMVETQADLTSAGLINTLGCTGLSNILQSTANPCCPSVTTTTTVPIGTEGVKNCCAPHDEYVLVGGGLAFFQSNYIFGDVIYGTLTTSNGNITGCWEYIANASGMIGTSSAASVINDFTSPTGNNCLQCIVYSQICTTTTTGPATTTTTTVIPPTTTTTTYTPVSTTTTVWYECVTPPQPLITEPGSSCETKTNKPIGGPWNVSSATDYLIDDAINGLVPLNEPFINFYWENSSPVTGIQCPSVNGNGFQTTSAIFSNSLNVLYVGGTANNWEAWINFLNSITPAVFTYGMSRAQVLSTMVSQSNNNSESWNSVGGICQCPIPPCYCIPCYTPGTYPCIYNNFVACDIAANATPCCQEVSTTTTTSPPTTTTTTTLALGLELCCPDYDQYLVPSGNFLYTLLQGLSIGSAHIFELTLPSGNVVETCAQVINNPNPTNSITIGMLLLSPTTVMDCNSFSSALDAGTYTYTGFEDGCCRVEDWHECITPPPLVPGISANWCGAQYPTTYVIPAGVNLGNSAFENRVEFINHIAQNIGTNVLFFFYHFINPTAPLSLDGCENLGGLYGGLGRHETVGQIVLCPSNTLYIYPGQTTTFSEWDTLITTLNSINFNNSLPQDFLSTDTWGQVITRMTNNAPGDALCINSNECGCFNPCYCQPCTPPAANCVYSTYALCDVAAQGNPCCNPTTTTTTVYCDRLGLRDCCTLTVYYVLPGTALYVLITTPPWGQVGIVLPLEISLPSGLVLISCFEIIDTACPTDPVVNGGWTTPQLPHMQDCISCLTMISSALQVDCVTTTTTQWWECVRGAVPVPGVDASGCDGSDTEVTPPGISTANGQSNNTELYINYVVSTYGTTAFFNDYFFINPSIIAGNVYVDWCENNSALYNGDGYYMKVNGFTSAALNTTYFLTAPVTNNGTWQELIDQLNAINANYAWTQDFLYTDNWGQVITKMQNHAASDSLTWQSRFCVCSVTCFCQPCSTGPNCVYNNEPDCLISATAVPCCVSTTTTPPTTTTTTSNLVGLKLCCDPYTEYEVIYNSSLYNLIDYTLPPFTRAMVMTITLANGADLTACVEMDMNIPPGSPQVQSGQFEWLFSTTNYMSDCNDLSQNATIYNGYGFPQFFNGCCEATTTTTTSAPLGVEDCCDPLIQYVATGNLLAYLQSYSVGNAWYGSLNGPSTTTPDFCFKIINNPSGPIVDNGVSQLMEESCNDLDTLLINTQGISCCPTTTTTTYPTTTTTTTPALPCSSCGILFVEGVNPPKVYTYNHQMNTTSLLFTATQVGNYSVDIATYDGKIWLYSSTAIQEYAIDYTTCTVTWEREISIPCGLGSGLCAYGNNTLIAGSVSCRNNDICYLDISSNSAVVSSVVPITGGGSVTGDLLYLGNNILLAAINNGLSHRLDLYDLSTGLLLSTVSSSLATYGLYCDQQLGVFGVSVTSDVYPIYINFNILSTDGPIQVVPNPPIVVYGAATDPDCCLPDSTTTTTTEVRELGVEMCCFPYTQYLASGSLLTYIQGLNVGDAFAATLQIGQQDLVLCIKVVDNVIGQTVSNFVLIANPHPMTCDGLNAHLTAYIPPGYGFPQLKDGCCDEVSTTTTIPQLEEKFIRACCPNNDGSYDEYRALPGSNLESMLGIAVIGTIYELTVLPQGGIPKQSQCYVVIASSPQFQNADGYTTLNMSFISCNGCNSNLSGPIPLGCLQLPS